MAIAWALAIGAFAIGTTEFVIAGVLPEVAADLGVSVPIAGILVTGYALGVVVGAPLLTVIGTRLPRKAMLVLLMVIFLAGNVLCALAPSHAALMAGRAVASFTHGAFFGIGSIVAAGLVPAHRKAAAIALMFTGMTLANVMGVPSSRSTLPGLGGSIFSCRQRASNAARSRSRDISSGQILSASHTISLSSSPTVGSRNWWNFRIYARWYSIVRPDQAY
ncbi:MFS transporter [Streptosporangium sp. NPDC003464]